jgi:hypothetical protein
MIPQNFEYQIAEPLRTLILEGIKSAGSVDAAEVLTYIEERLTMVEFRNVERFCKWLQKNSLSVGHGTIDLRWDEFQSKRTPVGRDEAYQWAMGRHRRSKEVQ